jgi:hypothetical protein
MWRVAPHNFLNKLKALPPMVWSIAAVRGRFCHDGPQSDLPIMFAELPKYASACSGFAMPVRFKRD